MLAASLLIIIQPLAETLIFQAILLPSLRWRLGPWRGLVITALIYTILHQLVFMAAYSPLPSALAWLGPAPGHRHLVQSAESLRGLGAGRHCWGGSARAWCSC